MKRYELDPSGRNLAGASSFRDNSATVRTCSGVNDTWKSKLKSFWLDDTQLKRQSIRFLKGRISFIGARDTTAKLVCSREKVAYSCIFASKSLSASFSRC